MSFTSSELADLLAKPALEAPKNVTANFENPPNRNGLAWFITTLCMVIATVAILIRAYAKLWVSRKVHVEEVLMLCAYGAYWCTAYAGYKLIYTPGYYVHQWNLHNVDLIEPLYLILVYGCAYSATLALVKVAILMDWCRFFVVGSPFNSHFWWSSMFIMSVQTTWGIACIILLNMQCVPHAAIWKFYLPSRCYSLPKVMLTSASVQVFSDWCMVLLPQKTIWGLKMDRQKKIGVSLVFGAGLLASISASVRLSTTITFSHEVDEMYHIGPLLFWACAEMTCGFFILSVPCIPNVIKESGLREKVGSAFNLSTKSSKNQSNTSSSTYGCANPLSARKTPKVGIISHDPYYNLDGEEGGLSLDVLDRSESQEHLHVKQENPTLEVTRTTQTIVTSDLQSSQSDSAHTTRTVVSSDLQCNQSDSGLSHKVTPWEG